MPSAEKENPFGSLQTLFWYYLLRAEVIVLSSLLLIVLIVKLFNKNDKGDHLFAAYISLAVYLTSFQVIKNSGFSNKLH